MQTDLKLSLPHSSLDDLLLNLISLIAAEVLILASREELERLTTEELLAEEELKALFFTCEEKAKEIETMEREIETMNQSLVLFEEREKYLLRERVELWPTLQEAGKILASRGALRNAVASFKAARAGVYAARLTGAENSDT